MTYIILVKSVIGDYVSTEQYGTMINPNDDLGEAKKLLRELQDELNLDLTKEKLVICELNEVKTI